MCWCVCVEPIEGDGGMGGPGVDGVEGNGHSQPGGYIGGLEGHGMLFGLIRDVIR